MRKPVVLSAEQVTADVRRLCGELRQARMARGISTRAAAARADINSATLWRIEGGESRPTLLRFLRLARAVGVLVDVDDGTGRALVPAAEWPAHPGYRGLRWRSLETSVVADPSVVRARLGMELSWARQHEFDEPLDAAAVCRLLRMSHHTLEEVEIGYEWPALASLIRVSALVGRTVVLNAQEEGWRTPPWRPEGG